MITEPVPIDVSWGTPTQVQSSRWAPPQIDTTQVDRILSSCLYLIHCRTSTSSSTNWELERHLYTIRETRWLILHLVDEQQLQGQYITDAIENLNDLESTHW